MRSNLGKSRPFIAEAGDGGLNPACFVVDTPDVGADGVDLSADDPQHLRRLEISAETATGVSVCCLGHGGVDDVLHIMNDVADLTVEPLHTAVLPPLIGSVSEKGSEEAQILLQFIDVNQILDVADQVGLVNLSLTEVFNDRFHRCVRHVCYLSLTSMLTMEL